MKRNKARIESRHKALVEKSSKDILIESLEDLDSDGKKHNYDLRFNDRSTSDDRKRSNLKNK